MGEVTDRLQKLIEPQGHYSKFMDQEAACMVEGGLKFLDRGEGEPAAVVAAVGELEAERDQLDQQVEALLSAVEEHRAKASIYRNKCGYFGPPGDEGRHPECDYLAGFAANDHDLYAAADQVRKEREQ
jgi:hypothetical protein